MTKPRVQTFFDAATSTATYLVSDPATGMAAIIDPVLDFDAKTTTVSTKSADAILTAIRDQGFTPLHVLETHVHADHLSAADYLRRQTGARIAIGAGVTRVQQTFIPRFEAQDLLPDGAVFDRLLNEDDELSLGDLTIRVMDTPGHTSACVTYLVGDAAFIGDTMFMPDFGTARTDFPGGDSASLYRSIHKIMALPPQTRVFVGHDYRPATREMVQCETTVAEQKAHNVHVHEGVAEADFVALRDARNKPLSPPLLVFASLQVNIRAGALPPPSAAGRVYLTMPVTIA